MDTDVYEVGHHGSHNGTTTELLDAVTPEIAVISVGKSTDGQGSSNRFNTFHYGHPRKLTVDMLSLSIQGRRSAPINVEVADAPEHFLPYVARKRMYATGWDGTVKIRAAADRSFIVTRNQ